MTLKLVLCSEHGAMEKILRPLQMLGGLHFLQRKLSNLLNRKLMQYGISADIAEIKLDQRLEKEIRIMVGAHIHQIDYERVEKVLLPLVLERFGQKHSGGLFGDILEILGDDRKKVLHAVLTSVDDGKKAKLMALLLEEYQDVFCTKLTKVLRSNHIDFTVDRIRLEV